MKPIASTKDVPHTYQPWEPRVTLRFAFAEWNAGFCDGFSKPPTPLAHRRKQRISPSDLGQGRAGGGEKDLACSQPTGRLTYKGLLFQWFPPPPAGRGGLGTRQGFCFSRKQKIFSERTLVASRFPSDPPILVPVFRCCFSQ